jgi:hypothetical protein
MKIFIAVTAYGDKIFTECALSILRNSHVLRDMGHTVMPFFYGSDCYLDRGRNVCVFKFLETDCTDMFFVDSDVGFDQDAMLKMINHDKDIVAGAYPYRNVIGFPVCIYAGADKRPLVEENSKLIKAGLITMGMTRIRRDVFETMIEKKVVKKDNFNLYNFFNVGMVFPDDNQWYGEDVVFCKRWQSIGGELWIEPNINFTHTGNREHKGNYFDYLQALPQPT